MLLADIALIGFIGRTSSYCIFRSLHLKKNEMLWKDFLLSLYTCLNNIFHHVSMQQ